MDKLYSIEGKKIWVAGHTGLVGSAVMRRLQNEPCDILTVSHADLDLTRQKETEDWMVTRKPDVIILAAAKVGGIGANSAYPADFLYENLAIAQNVIPAAHKVGVEKLLFLGSSCIYPKEAPNPIKEESLLTGPLEPTNEGYALAKIAGIKLCQFYRQQYGCDFISVMPTNLYGIGDNYDLETAHVIPALIHKLHLAKTSGASKCEIWGTGTPLREFLYADDLADALIHLSRHYSDSMPINVGSGREISIRELAELISKVIGFTGEIIPNCDKPDGASRKTLDCSRLSTLGWEAVMPLEKGLEHSYQDFLSHLAAKNIAA
jgi:GDP-L-fucose synthase